jgi:pilus assembly protein CpaB
MSIRVVIIGLILTSALALGMIAYQVAVPQHAPQAVSDVQPAPLTVSYLVAARPLTAGTLVRDEDFVARPVAPSTVPAGVLTDSPETRAELRGALVRRFLDANAPVMSDDVIRVRDRGFLAAVLSPGTRASSVAVDEVSGVSGLIWPGDRVDVILTQDLDTSTPASRRVVSERILQNARVIAVDQDIARGEPTTGQASNRIPRTVTLQLTPAETDKLAVAQRLGKLSLAVRSVDEGQVTVLGKSSTYSKDVTSVLEDPASGTTVRVIQGDQKSDVTFR